MSDINEIRIKQLRQKTDSLNNPFQSFPFGADGKFIDMFSGLDLEEELKIGGNHYVDIQNNIYGTTITEYYLTQSVDKIDSNTQQYVTHKVVTEFGIGTAYWIPYEKTLQDEEIPSGIQVGPKESDSDAANAYILLEDSEQEQKTTEIIMTLYKKLDNGYKDIHKKQIFIKQIINQQTGFKNYNINEKETQIEHNEQIGGNNG